MKNTETFIRSSVVCNSFWGSSISEIKNELFYLPDILFDYMFAFGTEKFRNNDYETLFEVIPKYSDMDMNGHTNVRQYCKWWLAECVPIIRGKSMKRAAMPEFTTIPAIC